jgi:hypothetical protein
LAWLGEVATGREEVAEIVGFEHGFVETVAECAGSEEWLQTGGVGVCPDNEGLLHGAAVSGREFLAWWFEIRVRFEERSWAGERVDSCGGCKGDGVRSFFDLCCRDGDWHFGVCWGGVVGWAEVGVVIRGSAWICLLWI